MLVCESISVLVRRESGGHFVNNEQVTSNFKIGLENLRKHINYFDRALVLSSINSKKMVFPKLAFRAEKGVIVERAQRLPKWAEKVAVEMPMKLERKEELGRGRKR